MQQVAAVHDPAAYSPAEFAAAHGISRATLYKLWAEGRGPRRAKVGRRTLIPGEAAAEWRERLMAAAEVTLGESR